MPLPGQTPQEKRTSVVLYQNFSGNITTSLQDGNWRLAGVVASAGARETLRLGSLNVMCMAHGASGADFVAVEIGLLILSSEERTGIGTSHLSLDVMRRIFHVQRWMIQDTAPWPWVSRMAKMITLGQDAELNFVIRVKGIRGSGGQVTWGADLRWSERETDI